MAGTHSKSIHKREIPQYAYALAIVSGGAAFILPQLGARAAFWLAYAGLAALFSFIWPHRALQWAGWLCLPIFLLIFFDYFATLKLAALLKNTPILVKALASACLGTYLGSKLSIRKSQHRSISAQAKRRRLYSQVNVPQSSGGLALKKIASPVARVMTEATSLIPVGPPALSPAVHVYGLNAALIKAAQEGDLDSIRRVIADGADVNAQSSDQWSPLIIAPQSEDVEMDRAMFGQGAAASGASGGKGWTALMVATVEGHLEVVRALLGCGAQVGTEDNKGWTALRFAVSMDETEILRALLDAGADANHADQEGQTALMQAAGENSVGSLKRLLDVGAKPRLKDHQGRTALLIAQKQGHAEIIKLLKEAEAQASDEVEAPLVFPEVERSQVAGKTHRVIKARGGQSAGAVDRYDVILLGAALPYGCEETGREGSEEECLDYAWESNLAEQMEPGWWLSFGSQRSA